jgi:shikimate kinase
MRIFIVGMPGSGKTTLGRLLAAATGMRAVDTDRLITEKHGKTPSRIITEEGEKTFRELESEILDEVLKMNDLIISTGGGFPIFSGNMDRMLQDSHVIYIKTSIDILWKRLKHDKTRPLSNSHDKLRKLYSERKPFYEKAGIIIDGSLDSRSNLAKALERLNALGIVKKTI